MATLAKLADALYRTGVATDTQDAADVLDLLKAISAEIRGQTKRAFEGVPTVYNEIIDAEGSSSFLLPHVPVTDLLSIARVYGDGTEESIYIPNDVSHDGVLSWSTTAAAAIAIGDTNIKVTSVDDIAVGDHMAIVADEVLRITAVGTAGSGGTGLTVEPAARFVNASGATVKHVSGSISWYLSDPQRGSVEMPGSRRLLRCIWRVSGDVPADIERATLRWLGARWSMRGEAAGLASYSTGDDSESYDAKLAGEAPAEVGRVLARYWRSKRNGVI